MIITKQEQEILLIIRELRPFETIEIVKDQLGRPHRYLVTRTQKLVLTTESKQLSGTL